MKFLKGGIISLVSIILLAYSLWRKDSFKSCAVPMGFWNDCFYVALLSVGIIYILDEGMWVKESLLSLCVKIVLVSMIVIFVWGDLFILLILADSPKCMEIIYLIIYIVLMFCGTLGSIIEGFSLLKMIVK